MLVIPERFETPDFVTFKMISTRDLQGDQDLHTLLHKHTRESYFLCDNNALR